MGKKLKKIFFIIGLAFLITFCILYLPFTQYKLAGILSIEEDIRSAESIVVLGGGLKSDGTPGVSTRERVSYGAFLFKVGFGDYLILSGGAVEDNQVEAEKMYEIALAKGVSPKVILKELYSSSTYENALYTKELLFQYNIKGEVILVTSPYHMRRALYCFKKQGIEVFPAPVKNGEIYTYGFYQSLRNVRLIMHEFLAFIYYKYSGWI